MRRGPGGVIEAPGPQIEGGGPVILPGPFQMCGRPGIGCRAFVTSPGLALCIGPDERVDGVASPARPGDQESPRHQLLERALGLARSPREVLLVAREDHSRQKSAGQHGVGGQRVQTGQDMPLEIRPQDRGHAT